MRGFFLTMVVLHLSLSHGWMEFGRERVEAGPKKWRVTSTTRTHGGRGTRYDYPEVVNNNLLLESLNDLVDTRVMLEISMSMSMSMPSAPTIPTPTVITPSDPPGPSVSIQPVASVAPTPSGSTVPSAPIPSVTAAPTVSVPTSTPSLPMTNNPDEVPTDEPTVSYEPSMTGIPSSTPSTPTPSGTAVPSVPTPSSTPSAPVTNNPAEAPMISMEPTMTGDDPSIAPSAPTPSGTAVPTVLNPASTPSAPMTSNPVKAPIDEPAISFEPSVTADIPSSPPAEEPTLFPTLSFEPSFTAFPTTVAANENCVIENGLSLGSSDENSTTPILLAVGYRAESTESAVDSFVRKLEEALLNTALSAIMGCEVDFSSSVFPETLEVASCTPTLDDAKGCFIMETEAILFLDGPVNEDEAAFEAYRTIQESMSGGLYTERVPTILNLQFLSPVPLPLPPGNGGGTSEPIPVSTQSESSVDVSPWTIGSSVAVVMGGFVSLLVWTRAKRFGQRRQQLMEETSWVNYENHME